MVEVMLTAGGWGVPSKAHNYMKYSSIKWNCGTTLSNKLKLVVASDITNI